MLGWRVAIELRPCLDRVLQPVSEKASEAYPVTGVSPWGGTYRRAARLRSSAMRNHGFRESIRSVTQEEIASFRENGWAYLPGLLACEIAETLHAQGEHLQRAQTQPLSCKPRRKTDLEDRVGKAFQSYLADDQAVELAAFAVSPVMGRNAAELLDVAQTRILAPKTNYILKMPESGGEQGATPFHQDYPGHAFDRSSFF